METTDIEVNVAQFVYGRLVAANGAHVPVTYICSAFKEEHPLYCTLHAGNSGWSTGQRPNWEANVRKALSLLKRQGKATNDGHARWSLVRS
jgi:hypothetical protein